MWNLKNKTKLIDTENRMVVAGKEEAGLRGRQKSVKGSRGTNCQL